MAVNSAGITNMVAVGLSNQTAPVEIRERLAFDEQAVCEELARLSHHGICDEAVLLSTCNRVELYAISQDRGRLQTWAQGFSPAGMNIGPYLYWKAGADVIHHLFRVASSLDSQIVGEAQILGQVKRAAQLAEDSHMLGRRLRPVIDRSFSVAKRVRTHTGIGKGRVGIGNAGVDLAMQVYGDLKGKRALLLGTGEMGAQVARALQNHGLDELLVSSRTFENATAMAEKHSATAIRWAKVKDYLSRVDVIIAGTGSRTPILAAQDIRPALRARNYRPLLLIDLSVPRNISPDVDGLDDAFLFNIDDLSQVVEAGKRARQEATEEASRLVHDEAERFVHAFRQIDIGPLIGKVARHAEGIRTQELSRSSKLLEGLDADQQAALDALTKSLVKKMMHAPITAIRQAARESDHEQVERMVSLITGGEE